MDGLTGDAAAEWVALATKTQVVYWQNEVQFYPNEFGFVGPLVRATWQFPVGAVIPNGAVGYTVLPMLGSRQRSTGIGSAFRDFYQGATMDWSPEHRVFSINADQADVRKVEKWLDVHMTYPPDESWWARLKRAFTDD